MSSIRKLALTVRILVVLAVLVVGLAAGLYFFLPRYLESSVIPRLLSNIGFSDVTVKVRHIGIHGAELGVLRIGPEQNPALTVRSVHIDYTLQNLLRKIIEGITVSGIELHGELKNGKFTLGSADLEQVLAKRPASRTTWTESSDEILPFFLKKLEIRNAIVIFTTADRTYRSPFEIIVTPEREDLSRLDLTASLYPQGDLVRAHAKIDLNQQHIDLDLSAALLDLDRFSGLVQMASDAELSGKMNLNVAAQLQLAPFKISSLTADAELPNYDIKLNNLRFRNIRGAGQKELPLKIRLRKITADEWDLSASTISADSPLPFTLSEWQARVRVNGKQVESKGEFKVGLRPSSVHQNNLLPLEVLQSLPVKCEYTAEYREDQSLNFKIDNTRFQPPSEPAVRFKFHQYDITAGMPEVDIYGKGKLEDLATAYMVRIPQVKIASQTKRIHLPQVLLKGTADLVSNGHVSPEATFKLQSPNTSILLSPAGIKIADLSISGQLKTNIKGAIGLEGLLEFKGADSSATESGIKISGGRGSIPLKWPPERQMKKGDISIASLYHKQLNVGKYQAL
jgi:hypothetical protein